MPGSPSHSGIRDIRSFRPNRKRAIGQYFHVLYLPAPRFSFPARPAVGLPLEAIKIVEEGFK